jgi:hypothetical protein
VYGKDCDTAVEFEIDSTSVVNAIRAGATNSIMGVALLEGIGRLMDAQTVKHRSLILHN